MSPNIKRVIRTVLLLSAAGTPPLFAQQVGNLATPEALLILQNRGSLIIGGDSIPQTPDQLSSIIATPPAEPGHITVNQMYGVFMEPQDPTGQPVIMRHSATLSGKT